MFAACDLRRASCEGVTRLSVEVRTEPVRIAPRGGTRPAVPNAPGLDGLRGRVPPRGAIRTGSVRTSTDNRVTPSQDARRRSHAANTGR